jgi:hypothetical protein
MRPVQSRPRPAPVFLAVDPANCLVASALERDWNENLTELAQLERKYTVLPPLTAHLVDAEERQHIPALAQDVPAIWHAPTTIQAERKQLLHCLIKV